MTTTDPHIHDRPAVPFIGTTTGTTMPTVAEVADRLPELIGALVGHRITPAGAPFFQYLDIRDDSMTVRLGVPVPAGAALPEHALPFPAEPGELPAGRYAGLTHVGPFAGIRGSTERLMAWAAEQGLAFDMSTVDGVEHWSARLEIYLTDPRVEPDPARFETDLAIRLAD